MATTPILDITTLIQRDTIRIDGTAYELKARGELTLFELARLQRTADRVHQIDQQADPTAGETAEYARLLEQAVRSLLVAPEAVHAALVTAHRESILWTFIGLSQPTPTLTRATSQGRSGRRTTLGDSARGSRGSTGARRRAG